MDFSKLLSPEGKAKLARMRADVQRCYALPNVELGSQIMAFCAEAKIERSELDYANQTYDTSLLAGILPELARRLGAVVPETPDTEFTNSTHQEFRYFVSLYLHNVGRNCGGYAWQFLTREACNGNPVVMGIDRLCAGDLDDNRDYITVSLKSVARSRGKPYNGVWTPDILMD